MKRTNFILNGFLALAIVLVFAQCSDKNNNAATSSAAPAAGVAGSSNMKIAYVEIDSLLTKYNFWNDLNEVMIQKEENIRTTLNEKAKKLDAYISVLSEAAVAVRSGVSAMHDVTEGGIFGALWEMAEASGVGLEIDLKKIPIRQETVEVCEFFGINPYKLISSGCMLMAAEDGNTLVRELEKEGIPATIIGKATEGNDRVLLNEDEKRFLEPPKTDELYEVMED